jgi:hypothetical protein
MYSELEGVDAFSFHAVAMLDPSRPAIKMMSTWLYSPNAWGAKQMWGDQR